MTSQDALHTYLNDHLAGSEAALSLLARLADEEGQDPLYESYVLLRSEIEADQDVLRALIARVGGGESGLKRAMGWLAERAARLKLGASRKDDAFAVLESLEVLALGIEGKRSLWRTLAVLAPYDRRLAGLDLDHLTERAVAQHASVERMRLAMARVAFRVDDTDDAASASRTPG